MENRCNEDQVPVEYQTKLLLLTNWCQVHIGVISTTRKYCYCYCFSTFECYYIMVLRASLLTHVALFHTPSLVKC